MSSILVTQREAMNNQHVFQAAAYRPLCMLQVTAAAAREPPDRPQIRALGAREQHSQPQMVKITACEFGASSGGKRHPVDFTQKHTSLLLALLRVLVCAGLSRLRDQIRGPAGHVLIRVKHHTCPPKTQDPHPKNPRSQSRLFRTTTRKVKMFGSRPNSSEALPCDCLALRLPAVYRSPVLRGCHAR